MSPPEKPLVVRLLPVLDFGGVESRVVLQSKLIDRSRFRYRVCALSKDGAAAQRIREAGVPVDVLDVDPSPRRPWAALRLARYLRRVRPDVLHSSIAEANVNGLIAGVAARVPVRITEEVGVPSHGRVARIAFGQLYRHAHAVVAVSQATQRYVRDVDRAPAERVRLIYNCAHPDFFPEDPPAPAGRAPGDPFRLLCVGRLVPVKNQARLIRAFARAARERPELRLDVVGEGPLRGELEALAERLDPDGRITFLGFQSDIRERMRAAHGFVLPSLSEGCSISLVEALSSGLPSIGSRADGIREVMGEALARDWAVEAEDEAGLSERLARLAALPEEERVRLAREGQRRAYEGFSPQVYMKNLQDLYEELLRRNTA